MQLNTFIFKLLDGEGAAIRRPVSYIINMRYLLPLLAIATMAGGGVWASAPADGGVNSGGESNDCAGKYAAKDSSAGSDQKQEQGKAPKPPCWIIDQSKGDSKDHATSSALDQPTGNKYLDNPESGAEAMNKPESMTPPTDSRSQIEKIGDNARDQLNTMNERNGWTAGGSGVNGGSTLPDGWGNTADYLGSVGAGTAWGNTSQVPSSVQGQAQQWAGNFSGDATGALSGASTPGGFTQQTPFSSYGMATPAGSGGPTMQTVAAQAMGNTTPVTGLNNPFAAGTGTPFVGNTSIGNGMTTSGAVAQAFGSFSPLASDANALVTANLPATQQQWAAQMSAGIANYGTSLGNPAVSYLPQGGLPQATNVNSSWANDAVGAFNATRGGTAFPNGSSLPASTNAGGPPAPAAPAPAASAPAAPAPAGPPSTGGVPQNVQKALQQAMQGAQLQSAMQALQGLMQKGGSGSGSGSGSSGSGTATTTNPVTGCYVITSKYMCPQGTAGTLSVGCVTGLDNKTIMCPVATTATTSTTTTETDKYNAGYLDAKRGLKVDSTYAQDSSYLSGYIAGLNTKALDNGSGTSTSSGSSTSWNGTGDTFPYQQVNAVVLASCSDSFSGIASAYSIDARLVPLAFTDVSQMSADELALLQDGGTQFKVFQLRRAYIAGIQDEALGKTATSSSDAAYKAGYSCAQRVL